MKSFIIVLFLILGLSHVFAGCGTDCTNAVEDSNLFTAGKDYGTWGLSYVRDPSKPPIQALHSAQITTAIIAIHGNTRDAFNYFCYTSFAVESKGESEKTFIVSPRFMIKSDNPQQNAFFWENNSAWKEGGKAQKNTTRISSFELLDDMVKAFYNKDYFPGMKDVLILGHSAGGQTVQRYAIATGIDSNYTVRYVVANPGTYTYLDKNRAILPNYTKPTCTACVTESILQTKYEFTLLPRSTQLTCPEYNDWKMGIDKGNVYLNLRDATEIRTQYGKKNIWYILSTSDTCNTELGDCGCNDNSLDTGCDALLLGYCRLMRGVAYYQYLQFFYNANSSHPIHKLSYIDNLGHDGCLVINSNVTLNAIFYKEPVVETPTKPANPTTTPIISTNAPATLAPEPKIIIEIKAILTISGNANTFNVNPIRESIASDLKVNLNDVTATVTNSATKKRETNADTFYLDVRVKYNNVLASETTDLQSQVSSSVQSETMKTVMASQGATITKVDVSSQTSPASSTPAPEKTSSSSFIFPSLFVIVASLLMLL